MLIILILLIHMTITKQNFHTFGQSPFLIPCCLCMCMFLEMYRYIDTKKWTVHPTAETKQTVSDDHHLDLSKWTSTDWKEVYDKTQRFMNNQSSVINSAIQDRPLVQANVKQSLSHNWEIDKAKLELAVRWLHDPANTNRIKLTLNYLRDQTERYGHDAKALQQLSSTLLANRYINSMDVVTTAMLFVMKPNKTV